VFSAECSLLSVDGLFDSGVDYLLFVACLLAVAYVCRVRAIVEFVV
jgi:hypothetical protein